MASKQTVIVQRSGVGFLGILFFIFLVLKLTGYITWSWWWVTAPLWGPIALVVGLAGLFAGVLVIAGILAFLVMVLIELIKRSTKK